MTWSFDENLVNSSRAMPSLRGKQRSTAASIRVSASVGQTTTPKLTGHCHLTKLAPTTASDTSILIGPKPSKATLPEFWVLRFQSHWLKDTVWPFTTTLGVICLSSRLGRNARSFFNLEYFTGSDMGSLKVLLLNILNGSTTSMLVIDGPRDDRWRRSYLKIEKTVNFDFKVAFEATAGKSNNPSKWWSPLVSHQVIFLHNFIFLYSFQQACHRRK